MGKRSWKYYVRAIVQFQGEETCLYPDCGTIKQVVERAFEKMGWELPQDWTFQLISASGKDMPLLHKGSRVNQSDVILVSAA